MSTREIAYKIVSRLDEQQLKAFIAEFGSFDDTADNTDYEDEKKLTDAEIEERMEALREIEAMTRPIPDFDYKKNLYEYLDERYGV